MTQGDDEKKRARRLWKRRRTYQQKRLCDKNQRNSLQADVSFTVHVTALGNCSQTDVRPLHEIKRNLFQKFHPFFNLFSNNTAVQPLAPPSSFRGKHKNCSA